MLQAERQGALSTRKPAYVLGTSDAPSRAPEKQQQRRIVKEDAMTGKEKKREVNEKRNEKKRKNCKD
jgi:hypothetical protein